MDSSKKKLLILGCCAALFILIVFGSNMLYARLSENAKSQASEKLVDDLAKAKEEANIQKENSKSPSDNSENKLDSSAESENASDNAQNNSSETQLIKAPDFTVYTNDGTPVTLHEKFGKPIIINFWATWCGPCKNEMPDFEKAYREFGDKIEFMMINPTDGINDTHESVDKFIADTGYTFPVYRDTDVDAAAVYGISAFPTTFFVDSDGYLLGYYPGMMDEATLYACIDIVMGNE